MATATSRKAQPDKRALAARRAAAEKLLGTLRRLKPEFAAIDALEAELKAIATKAGASFREDFDKGDYISVAPGHEAEFKGDVPVVQTEAWLALPPGERKKLVASGLIKVEPQWGKRSSGRVTPKVH